MEGLLKQGAMAGIMANPQLNPDIRSLRELLTYGLKGMAAYADHAHIFGESDETVKAFFHKALAALLDDALIANDLLELNMELGRVNLRCMEILDKGHTRRLGHPVPTPVSLGVRKGPAILVSGHDLLDLHELLTPDRRERHPGIHPWRNAPGPRLPGPEEIRPSGRQLRRRLAGPAERIRTFPGSDPDDHQLHPETQGIIQDRIFTTGLVAWPGVTHIPERKDFSQLIAKAVELGGFAADEAGKTITVGFGHQAVLGAAEQVVAAVKAGKIRHFFLIGGCDGAKSGRNYLHRVRREGPGRLPHPHPGLRQVPLQQARFRHHRRPAAAAGRRPVQRRLFGHPDRPGPGQCLRGGGQRTAAVAGPLLVRAEGGDRAAHPSVARHAQHPPGTDLPAFLTPNVLKVLIEKFAIKPIGSADEDIRLCLQGEK